MSVFTNKTITNAGMNLIAQGMAGGSITFKNILLGSGTFTGQDLANQTALVKVENTLPITGVNRNGSTVSLTTTLTPQQIQSDYAWSELGVIAEGETGGEILYLYGHTTQTSIISRNGLDEKIIQVTLLVSNVQNVTATIDSSLVYLTQAELDNHNEGEDSHADIRQELARLNEQMEAIDISWDSVNGKPQKFPPEEHTHHDRYLQLSGGEVHGNIEFKGIRSLVWDVGRPEKTNVFWNASTTNDFGLMYRVDGVDSFIINKQARPQVYLDGAWYTTAIEQDLANKGLGTTSANLPSGTNLDDVINNGFYMVSNPNNAPITNGSYWWYIDVKNHNGQYILQKATWLNPHGAITHACTEWTRIRNGASWGKWCPNTATVHTIEYGVDFNSITLAGTYLFPLNVNAQACPNVPTHEAGVLEVIPVVGQANEGCVLHRYTTFSHCVVYQRRKYENAWSAWVKNPTANDLDSLKQSVSNGKNAIASAITAKGVSASGSDSHSVLANKIGQIPVGPNSTRKDAIADKIYLSLYYNIHDDGLGTDTFKEFITPTSGWKVGTEFNSSTYKYVIGDALQLDTTNGQAVQVGRAESVNNLTVRVWRIVSGKVSIKSHNYSSFYVTHAQYNKLFS
ncbi:phage tail-collar fiber domain-containing protein [Zhenhengia yiwuensis]|uniref:Phage tail fibre protein N-terminal domain-containing protein n=1 Tax=Zhenhengia yiwuensis TaxID=2763666 RepID=A0A926IE14_9FIRM|nr:phage tail protein [Zhenhengia yiwuensis]MBC8579126.1 hypothetical protein [Zhenhengia yiwuensis]